jgi:hypothetical protein
MASGDAFREYMRDTAELLAKVRAATPAKRRKHRRLVIDTLREDSLRFRRAPDHEKMVWDRKRGWETHIIPKRDPYRFTLKEIDHHRCKDCGINVIKIGDYCLLAPQLWEDRLGLKWNDNLCVACIEKRLGRRLEAGFKDWCGAQPQVMGFPMSALLFNRFYKKRLRKTMRRRRYGPFQQKGVNHV